MSIDRNSLLFWFPKTKDLGILIPKTEIVEIPTITLLEFMDNAEALRPYANEIRAKANKIGFPLFLRTDQASGKHDWKNTCYVDEYKNLFNHIYRVVDFNFSADILGLRPQALVFREFIELDWKFKAFHGMPVARERRYFIKDGEVLCHHPYWIEDAVERPDKKNWRELLRGLNTETNEEIYTLTDYAKRVASVIDGFWSVDFAYAKSGRWLLIDMALGEKSWHPGCPYLKTKPGAT